MLQIPILDWTLGELMLFFQNDWNLAWVLILSGGLTAIWLLENITDPIPLLGTLFDGLVHLGTFLGFFVGILDLLVGYVVWAVSPEAIWVAIILIVMGFSLVMRVLTKFPLAFLFALAIAVFGTATIYGILEPYTTMIGIGDIIAHVISIKGLLVIGFVIFCVVYLLGGLLIKLIELIGKVFASTPVSIIIGLAAIAIGVIILYDPTILSLAWPPP